MLDTFRVLGRCTHFVQSAGRHSEQNKTKRAGVGGGVGEK